MSESVTAARAAPMSGGGRNGRELGAWWMVFAVFLMYVLAWLDRLIISMMVGPIKESLALSDFQMNFVLGPAFAISYAIFGMPLGWAADHYARRWVIFGGILTWTLATVACGFANSFPALMICRIFVGIGEAALLPAAYSLIAISSTRSNMPAPRSRIMPG